MNFVTTGKMLRLNGNSQFWKEDNMVKTFCPPFQFESILKGKNLLLREKNVFILEWIHFSERAQWVGKQTDSHSCLPLKFGRKIFHLNLFPLIICDNFLLIQTNLLVMKDGAAATLPITRERMTDRVSSCLFPLKTNGRGRKTSVEVNLYFTCIKLRIDYGVF